MKILYVEDNPHDVDLTQRNLRRLMQNVYLDNAPTLADARAYLSQPDPYDVLLIDLALPDGSGLDLLREVRQQELPIAVVILTGSGNEEAAVNALKAGADDYVVKRKNYLDQLPLSLKTALSNFNAEAQRRSHPIRVLYIEDDPIDLDLTRRHLARHAPHILLDVTHQAADVLQLLDPAPLTPLPYDLLLLDYQLGDLNALDLLKALQQNREFKMPVLLITGQGNEEIATQALRLGAADYLVKHERYLLQLPAALENAYYRSQLVQEQKALRESEARYRRLAENAQDIIYRYRLGPEPGFDYVNPAVAAITGYAPDDYYANPELTAQIFRPFDLPQAESDHDLTILNDPRAIQLENKAGDLIWVEIRHVPVHDEQGRLIAIEGIARDVTEREQVQARLRDSEETFRLLFAANPHPMWVYDLETLRFLEVNESAIAHYGFSRDEFLCMHLADIRPQEDVERLLADAKDNRPVLQRSGEWRHKLKDGRIIDVEITSHTLTFGRHAAALVVAQDITERVRAQRAEREQRVLAEALRDTAAALSSAPDLETMMISILENVARVAPHDAANIMLLEGGQARPAYWRGYPPELEALLREFVLPLAEAPNLQEMFVSNKPFLVPYTENYPGWFLDPLTSWVRSHVAVPIRSHGLVLGFVNLDSATPGFFTKTHVQRLQAFADQTSIAIERAQLYEEIRSHASLLEQRVAERTTEVQRSEARYRAIVEDQIDMVCRYLPGGILTFVNRAYCTMFNTTDDEIIGTSWFLQLPEPERTRLQQHVASIHHGMPIGSIEMFMTLPSGGVQWISWVTRMLFDEMGNFVEYQTVGRDITQLKQAAEQLRQTLEREMELNELKSRFVSMASHEFRTPLAVIQSTSDLLKHYGSRMNGAEQAESFSRITSSINTMIELMDDVLTVTMSESGKLEFRPTLVNLRAFCQERVAEFQQTIGSQHQLDFTASGNCTHIITDSKLLRHIVGNLLSNAIKYSPAGSRVSLEMTCTPNDIMLRVEDEGIGIPSADQAHLFELFHRASNVGGTPGTGLGLAIVKQSVNLCRGSITFESEVGRGTAFTVTLPQPANWESDR
ncbi:PAS domain S-box protein [Aggregatilinea lenta]|uniref:PAS domain S-box protein n=1 Tax=Aggregatilinea lenta TaxID=913108 RepID=UPI000E5C27EF|nr:PAS domain S-box protein [Aggregatilinea lenta]